MNRDEEAKRYIAEMKKKGLRLLRIADMSPEELAQELFVSQELARSIIALARKEVLKKMKKKSGGDELRMLPHIGQKRAQLLHEKNMTFKKIAEMSPEELMQLIPHLRRADAEDIIIAAEIKIEESHQKSDISHDPLFKLPYMSASRRRTLIKKEIGISDIARMKPEDLMKILPGLGRKQAEQMIISAELMVENKRRRSSKKAPRPAITLKRREVKHTPPGRLRRGLVNGNSLVNGRGVVNGLGISPAPPHRSKIPVLLIALVIFISGLVPIFLFAPAHEIVIDGHFSDWSGVAGAYDPFGTSDGALQEVKGYYIAGNLYIYARFADTLFKNPEGLFIFIDSDDNSSTGYSVGSLGADYMIRIVGWNGTVHQKGIYRYTGTSNDNWTAFISYATPLVGVSGSQIETSINIDSSKVPEFMVVEKEGAREDLSYIPVTPGKSGAFVYVNTVKNSTSTYFSTMEKIHIYPYGKPELHLHLIPFGELKNLNYTVRVLYHNTPVNKGFWVNISATKNITLDTQVKTQGTGSIGFRVSSEDSSVNIINNVTGIAVGGFKRICIDGNFSDWRNVSGVSDPRGDVQPAIHYIHENIDLKEIKRYDTYFYIQTYAPILAGDVIPEIIKRTLVDSDRDTVPDKFDPYPHDFNNDGIPDNESYVIVDGKKLPDVDGDGIPDYPYGPDMWLNTTIPSWFPKPYAGRHVSVYIGPVPKIKVTGNDTFMVFIQDRNGSYHAPFLPFKSSYMVLISGKGFDA
ncbi:MAG: hypothetical protein GXO25_06000, partial [Euryarchaeota archaeon]|nr:hypothetical protein [Euryarchaeota archaeon]